MKKLVPTLGSAMALATLTVGFVMACSDSSTSPGTSSGNGTMVVQLTDAPFLADSLKSVDIYVVRAGTTDVAKSK